MFQQSNNSFQERISPMVERSYHPMQYLLINCLLKCIFERVFEGRRCCHGWKRPFHPILVSYDQLFFEVYLWYPNLPLEGRVPMFKTLLIQFWYPVINGLLDCIFDLSSTYLFPLLLLEKRFGYSKKVSGTQKTDLEVQDFRCFFRPAEWKLESQHCMGMDLKIRPN